jgi:hypothetical protein
MNAIFFGDRRRNLREVNMQYGRLIVFIRHDFAEIWGFRYGLTLIIGTLTIMVTTGVFRRIVFSLKRPISSFPCSPSIFFTYLKHMKSHSHLKMGPERDFCEGRQRTKQTERQPRIVVVYIKLNNYVDN